MPSFLYTAILLLFPLSVLPVAMATKLYIIAFIFVTTAFLPAISIMLLYLIGGVQDLTLEERKQRLFPNLFTSMIYAMVCYLMYDKLHFGGLMLNTMIGATVLVVLLSFTTLFWKISLHGAGICGLLGFLVGVNHVLPLDYMLETLVFVLILAGIVMSSRLYLGAHKMSQVVAGAMLGGIVGVIIPVFFL